MSATNAARQPKPNAWARFKRWYSDLWFDLTAPRRAGNAEDLRVLIETLPCPGFHDEGGIGHRDVRSDRLARSLDSGTRPSYVRSCVDDMLQRGGRTMNEMPPNGT